MTDEIAPLPLISGERPPVADAVKVKVLDDGSGHHHSARTKARKAALDVLYDAEVTERDPLELLIADPTSVRPLTDEIVNGVVSHGNAIDQTITLALMGDWTLQRMPAIDRALARLATWELLYTHTPQAAVIAEAVALADEYSTDGSASFLTAVLGRVADALNETGHGGRARAATLDRED